MFSGAHGKNDSCSASDGIASGVNTLAGCQAVVTVGNDAAMRIYFQAWCGRTDQRIRAGSDGHDHTVDLERKGAAFLWHWTAPSGSIRLAEFHFLADHSFDVAIFVSQYFNWVGKGFKDNPFLFCVFDFFFSCRQFVHAAPGRRCRHFLRQGVSHSGPHPSQHFRRRQ